MQVMFFFQFGNETMHVILGCDVDTKHGIGWEDL